ncbi:MAG: nucleoside triphosphate pyrophosphohydrolase [Desulfobacteraceae bacterium 4572_88]|nr:MAG: nucleoside triphosphate pyrophosphohydrolase [Desulfobacteraceae bacterium 4572_88]
MNYKNIEALIELVTTLRGENGCPWDQKQTPQTMMVYLLEEAYELFDAIEKGTPEEVCEELGDVFFHIFFIARLFQEAGHFDIEDVARSITRKMIHRHPHVFGDATVNSDEEIRERWHKLKKKEKPGNRKSSALDSVPGKLPALIRAYRISERAARTGFDWENISEVMQKAEEEWGELKSELAVNHQENMAMELGDVLFTLTNVARFARIHPETALASSTQKFEKRFRHMEKTVSESGRDIDAASREEMDQLWEDAKQQT